MKKMTVCEVIAAISLPSNTRRLFFVLSDCCCHKAEDAEYQIRGTYRWDNPMIRKELIEDIRNNLRIGRTPILAVHGGARGELRVFHFEPLADEVFKQVLDIAAGALVVNECI